MGGSRKGPSGGSVPAAACVAAVTAARWIIVAALPAGAAAAAEDDPKNPFGTDRAERADARPGRIELSDGNTIRGAVWMTRGSTLEIFEDAKNLRHEMKFSDVARIENAVEEEKIIWEWRFKEGGSDEKIFTGRTCAYRRYSTVVTKTDGTTVKGHMRGTVIYIDAPEGRHKYFLRQDHRSEWGGKMSDLVYVKAVVLVTDRLGSDTRQDRRSDSGQGDAGAEKSAEPGARIAPGAGAVESRGDGTGKATESGGAGRDRPGTNAEGKAPNGERRRNGTGSEEIEP